MWVQARRGSLVAADDLGPDSARRHPSSACPPSPLFNITLRAALLVPCDKMSSPVPSLRVRVNQIDHTLAAPGPLDSSTLPRVPIIRVYGESSTGQKACVHIHQAYPYFFVEYPGKMNPDSGE